MRELLQFRPAPKYRTALLLTLLTLLILFLLAPKTSQATPQAQTTPAGAVTILQSDDNGLTFELTPPTLQQTPVQLAGSQYHSLHLDGYGHMALAGQPDLPQSSLLIGLPPGAEATLTLLDSSSRQLENVAVLPAVSQTLANEDVSDLVHLEPDFIESYTPDRAAYAATTPFPDSPVSLGETSWLRDQRVVQVWVRPVQATPAGATITIHDRLQIRVDFTYPNGRPAAATTPRPESATYETTLQANILNYDEAQAWRQPRPVTNGLLPVSPCLDSNAFRITLQETGMYKLTYSELANAGLSGSLTSSTIRMCSEDQEISIRVIDGGDGSFGSGDYVLFHGEALKTQETTTNVYWFTSGGSNGLRMASNNEAANTNTPSDYAKTLHLEEDHVYRSETPMNDNNDHWYWALLTYNPTAGLDAPFTVNNRIGTGYMVNVQVEVYGRRTSTGVPTDYRFEVKLNNQSVGIGQFTGSNNTRYLFSGDIDASALQEGSNLITIQPLDVNGSYYFFALNWIEVNVRRQFVAQNNRLAFTQDTAGDWKFQASGFNGSADVYNVTDPKNPVRMTNAAGSGTVTFSQDLSAPAGYEMVTASAYRSAQSIVKDTPSNWRSPNTADYIIITDPSLDSTALSSLRQKRTNQGLIVKTVYVQDIFDEFGYGIYSTQAIADFLAYAYEFWDNNGQSPPPTYALLVGEGSYDHRNILGENGPGDNLVPVYLLSGIDSNIGETTADNRYVAFGSDALAQMDLGRLPVKNTTELTTVVNKILAYENAPYDPRRASTHFFVADNAHNPSDCYLDPAGDFFANVNNFIGDFIGPNGQILKRVYYAPLSCYPNSDYPVYEPYYAGTTIDIQQRVISQYNAGPQFIVYTGHSGTLQWGKDSERFLTTTSIQTLANGDRTTIMLPMTCLEGLYHFPADEDAGLSESLLRLTTGGAVASFAPTGLQVQTAHNLLLDGFYMGLYEQGATTLGQAVMEAKVNLKLNGGSQYQDLQDTFMLLGDPAMQVKTWHSSYQVSVPAIVKP